MAESTAEDRVNEARARLEKAIAVSGKEANEFVIDCITTDVNILHAEERPKYLSRLAQAGYKFNEDRR